jgi:TRAP-type C4-dicarboxylate transport system substrate-binding protein
MRPTGAILAGALALGLAAPAAAQTTWDMPNEYSATSIHAEGDKVFAARLEELTDGGIQIVHHFGGALGFKSADQLDAVGDGVIPIADTYVGPLGGIDAMFLLPSLPFLASSVEEARHLFEVAREDYETIFAENNQKLLWSSPWPPSGIWANKPVDSVDALEGLKIRTYDANGTVTLREAGAAPIQLSWADVVPQLSAGGIDAVLTSAEGGASSRFWEHLSHFTEVNYAMPLNMVHINLDVWEGLTDAEREAVLEAAKAAEDHVWEAVRTRVQENYADMRENGMTVVTDVPAAFLEHLSEAGQKAREQWLEKTGATGEEILAEYGAE